MNPLVINGDPISASDVAAVARSFRPLELGPKAIEALNNSRRVIDRVVRNREPVYGISTGFGKFADRAIPIESLEELQRNLVLSHSVGVGEPLPEEVVRTLIALRVIALAKGYSGIRVETVQALIDMLNARIVPLIPSKGSVGASGDLAPLAHLALVLIGNGQAFWNGDLLPGHDALARAGLTPVQLTAKEGLALINGTQQMTAHGALLIIDAHNVLDVADIAGALTLEAVRGTNRAFDERVQAVRPHPGQIESARRLRELTESSEIMASHRHDSHRIQDAYSLRCMPQVHGASRDAIAYTDRVIQTEINSATDNPLVFPEDDDVISCGNFHGQPVAMALDFAAIALAELADISERRIEAMLDPHFSELPPFLTMNAGVDSGFMVSQYTAAALVSENKILAHPASVDSIPTSANQEDHVSMGATAALKAVDVIRNVETVLAIELLCAAEGIDHRRPLHTSPQLEAVHRLIRKEIAPLDGDRPLYEDIQRATQMVREGAIRQAASRVTVG